MATTYLWQNLLKNTIAGNKQSKYVPAVQEFIDSGMMDSLLNHCSGSEKSISELQEIIKSYLNKIPYENQHDVICHIRHASLGQTNFRAAAENILRYGV